MGRPTRGGGRLDSGLLIACAVVSAVALALPPRMRDAVAGAMRSGPFAPLVALQRRAEKVHGAIVNRPVVLATAGRRATDALAVPALAEENRSLRALLGLAARLEREFVVAEVLGGGPFSEARVLLLGAGRDAGVEPFTPVVTGDGLVGMVESVDAVSSTVVTWAHPDFRVSAMTADAQAFGIVQPHAGSGAERLLLELRGVPFRDTLRPGTVVVSAGLGGTYPRGIPIGTVIEELVTRERWSRAYLVRPAALTSNVDAVVILRAARRDGSVGGVWLSLAASDSAAARARAAGDSIARLEALAEVAARRAALARVDSLAGRDSVAGDSAGPAARRRAMRPDSAPPDSGPPGGRRP